MFLMELIKAVVVLALPSSSFLMLVGGVFPYLSVFLT